MRTVGHFSMRISRVYTRMIHRRGFSTLVLFINPRRACAARVTVVGSVCLLSHISPMERLFVLKTLSRTQRATKVKKFVGFSLKPLRCRDPAPPPLYGYAYSRPFLHAYFSCIYARDTPPRVQHFSAFHWVCLCVCLCVC